MNMEILMAALILMNEEKVDLSKSGIEWHRGIESVTGKGRPILLFQLLGNLDDKFC
jgi:hypothetical protein